MRAWLRWVFGASVALYGCAAIIDLRDDYRLGDGEDAGVDGTAGEGCTNGALDGTESDVDCGGTCPKCAVGRRCQIAADFTSGVWQGGPEDLPGAALRRRREERRRDGRGLRGELRAVRARRDLQRARGLRGLRGRRRRRGTALGLREEPVHDVRPRRDVDEQDALGDAVRLEGVHPHGLRSRAKEDDVLRRRR